MKRLSYLTILCLLISLACTKKPDKVTQPAPYSCSGKYGFKTDTTPTKLDSIDNTVRTNDYSIENKRATRFDIRLVEKTGNMLVLTVIDVANDSVPRPGNYVQGSNIQFGTMRYFLPEYKNSGYEADSMVIILTSFDEARGIASGQFFGRLINASTNDTNRIRTGFFDNICVTKIQ